jgi:hypothetical protein
MNRGARFGVYKKTEYLQVQGLCTGSSDPDLWFSDTPDQLPGKRGVVTTETKHKMVARTVAALSICAICPAKKACLEEGMKPQNLEYGVWGGTLPGERIVLTNRSLNSSDTVNRIAFAKQVREAERLLLGEASPS